MHSAFELGASTSRYAMAAVMEMSRMGISRKREHR